VQFKADETGGRGGFVKMWINGNLIASTTGKNVINGADGPIYFKLACYPSGVATPAAGIWWHHYKVKTFLDNAGAYTLTQIRSQVT
jgi:hypothetical protein